VIPTIRVQIALGVLCLATFGCSQSSLQPSKEQGEAVRHCLGVLRFTNMKECVEAKTKQLLAVKEAEGVRAGQRSTQAQTRRPDQKVKALVIDPNDSGTIYAGTLDQGMLKSNDGGQSWVQMNGWIPNDVKYQGEPATPAVTFLVIDPVTPRTVYVGADNGMYKTTDGGVSWKTLFHGRSGVIAIDGNATSYQAPGTLYFGRLGAIQKTTDGGHSWTTANTGRGSATVSLALDPQRPNTIYAGVTGEGMYKTTDSGGHWKQILGNGTPKTIVVDQLDSNIVYTGTSRGLFKTTDGGENWLPIGNGIPESHQPNIKALILSPKEPNVIYAMTNHTIHKSINGGENWKTLEHNMTGSFAMQFSAIGVDPSSHSIYVGSWGGVFRINDDDSAPN